MTVSTAASDPVTTPAPEAAAVPAAPPTAAAEASTRPPGPPPAPAAPGDSAEPGPGPWAADLERFPEETRSDVDAYLRDTWQPRVTQLEQSQLGEGQQQFWSDFNENPHDTSLAFLAQQYGGWDEKTGEVDSNAALLGLVEQVYGEDAVPLFETALEYLGDDSPEAPEATEQPQYAQLSPEQQAVLDRQAEQYEEQDWSADIAALREQFPESFPEHWTAEQVSEVIAPFVVAAPEEMDGDEALVWAHETYAKVKGLVESRPGEEAEAAEEVAAQVATLPAGGPNPTVPTEPDYQGDLGAAMRDFTASLRQQPPPTL